jgi:Icc-related predicted phosphoesterase
MCRNFTDQDLCSNGEFKAQILGCSVKARPNHFLGHGTPLAVQACTAFIMNTDATRLRIAAVADVHCTKKSFDVTRDLLSAMAKNADVVLLGGDLCDTGTVAEAEVLARAVAPLNVPVIAVFGNHDYECGKAEEVEAILSEAGVTILDGKACEIEGVGFAGVKGFAGGFGERALQGWGEPSIKSFVREAVEEALKLESALATLRTEKRVALLHYAPIVDTVMGEPPEIYPFLGSSRLEEPLNRYSVAAVFHGHAHRGTIQGVTQAGVPVYNVARPLLLRSDPRATPYRVFEIDRQETRRNSNGASH